MPQNGGNIRIKYELNNMLLTWQAINMEVFDILENLDSDDNKDTYYRAKVSIVLSDDHFNAKDQLFCRSENSKQFYFSNP